MVEQAYPPNRVNVLFAIKEVDETLFRSTRQSAVFVKKFVKNPLISRFVTGIEHTYKEEYNDDLSAYKSISVPVVRSTSNAEKYVADITNMSKQLSEAARTTTKVDSVLFIEVSKNSESKVTFAPIWTGDKNLEAREEKIAANTLNSYLEHWDESWKWEITGPSDELYMIHLSGIDCERKAKITIAYKDEDDLAMILGQLWIMMFPNVKPKIKYFESQPDSSSQDPLE